MPRSCSKAGLETTSSPTAKAPSSAAPAELRHPIRAPRRRRRKCCVVLVIDDFEYGGAQRQVVELANNLDESQFEVHVCSLSSYVPLAAMLKEGKAQLHILGRDFRWNPSLVLGLTNLLRRLRADIVHSYLFGADIVTRLASRLLGTPVVIGSERNTRQMVTFRHKLAYRLTKSCIDLVIANSRAGAEFHRQLHGYKPSQYRVVYNGVDTRRFAPASGKRIREELGIAPDEPVVGMFASLKPQKNHTLFYAAAAHVLDRMGHVCLMLVGDELHGGVHGSNEYKRQVDGLARRLGIRSKCLMLGNRDDVWRLYPACDVTVLSSLYEGTPNVVLESMACGVPVVVTDVSDNSIIVPDGQVGYVVPNRRPRIMADRICRLLEDDQLRQSMSRCARVWAMREFSTKRLAEKTAAIYQEGLAHRRKNNGKTAHAS